jgi:peroxiredoxin
MTQMTPLHPGDRFPALAVALAEGRTLRLPDALAGHYGVVVFCRGSWCPYCNAQLRASQRSLGRLTDVDTLVVALSADDQAATRDLIARHGLQLPVGHSADARAIAAATGAFVNEDPAYLQPAGFVLDPGARVVVSVYSTGAIGRLAPEDVIGLIGYLRAHSPSAGRREWRPTRRPAADTQRSSHPCAGSGKTAIAADANKRERNSVAVVRRLARRGPPQDNHNGSVRRRRPRCRRRCPHAPAERGGDGDGDPA